MKSKKHNSLKFKIHEIIFEADTPAGKFFDVALLIFIIASVVVALIESVPSLHNRFPNLFYIFEWIFTIFFTIEYILRLYSTLKPIKYAMSFYGIIDLLAILPKYISIFFAGTNSLIVIRALRLLRIFRIFKMVTFVREAEVISQALYKSSRKILVFLFAILMIVVIVGSIMYLVEGGVNPDFDSIPRSIYWAIVTLTTVGYGDISPNTSFGQFIAAFVMILGYAVIAVPTGIVTNELMNPKKVQVNTQCCMHCSRSGHDDDATFCKYCGNLINGE
ncbi:ion transporter [Portibacter lacus]|uniref:Ion transporter n=1 Tax=Portibacter lacus TaxID=1099794 RepID=A0AA37SRU5_9BACT|nr:ion transporter [Portibacter lacus]GLR19681.1 ion transporter [Portibacter lacus]